MFDVCGIGSSVLDYLCEVDHYPAENEKIVIERFGSQGGGLIGTALVAVARLGGKACYHGKLANDEKASQILESMKSEGVDVSHTISENGINPFVVVVINKKTGSRTILYTQPTSLTMQESQVDESLIANSKVLLIDFFHPQASLAAVGIASKRGIPVVVDAEKVTPLSLEIARRATHVIASKDFAFQITGRSRDSEVSEVLEQLAAKIPCPFLGITLGADGAIGIERPSRKEYFQRAYEVEVVDTTGAGDVFHGAFAFFLSQGFPISKALSYSAACAAMKCREHGGRQGIPTMNDLIHFLDRQRPAF
jgi:ribokinase